MSQEKVDRHKYEKTHRKQIVAKKKLERALTYIIAFAIIAIIVIWAVFSFKSKVEQNSDTVAQTYVNTTAIDDYITSLNE